MRLMRSQGHIDLTPVETLAPAQHIQMKRHANQDQKLHQSFLALLGTGVQQAVEGIQGIQR